MLQWFRKRLRAEEQAPSEAASPVAREEERAGAREGASNDEAERRTRRRRGGRGGRGRKKATVDATGPPERGRRGAEKPDRAEERSTEPKKAADRPRRQRRARAQPKRPELPDVKKEILVSVEVTETRVAVLEDGKPAEVYLERRGRRSIAGNVYKGVVDNVLPGMEASFVDIGLEKNGFLYVDEIVVPELEGRRHAKRIQELIQRGERVLVQAVKDPMGTKGARLTTEISLPGRFLVFTPFGEGIGVSRRLEDDERDRLKAIVKELELPEGGVIVRTAAEGASREELELDLALLRKLWATIQGRAARAEPPALVYREAQLPLRIVRDLFIRDFARVVVDHEQTHRRIVGYLKRTSPELAERVELYGEKQPLMERYGVDDAIRSTLDRRVDLPSGGYLVFDYAEAFTVIDVNTGRFVGARAKGNGAKLEDTITKNNLEAVAEVVRQLRLRDVGGIIVIDFIDMANPKNREAVEAALKRELERDRTKTYVVEISPLGLVEMTRQNVTDGPREILTVTCPTCSGDAVVVSGETHAVRAERKLRGLAAASRHQAFRVELNSRIAGILIGPGGARLDELEEETGRRFVFETRDELPPDHFAVLAKGSVARIAGEGFPVEAGQELEVKLEEPHVHEESDAIARLNGYVISVAGARPLVGQTVRVRVDRAERTAAYAVLAGTRLPEPPIEAEIELAEGGGGAAGEQPKKRTRRGTRGGRARRKKGEAERTEGELASEAATPDGDEPPVEVGTETPPESGDAAEKPKRKTRRGTRGGRGRRRKQAVPAVESGVEEAVDRAPAEPVATVLRADEGG